MVRDLGSDYFSLCRTGEMQELIHLVGGNIRDNSPIIFRVKKPVRTEVKVAAPTSEGSMAEKLAQLKGHFKK